MTDFVLCFHDSERLEITLPKESKRESWELAKAIIEAYFTETDALNENKAIKTEGQ